MAEVRGSSPLSSTSQRPVEVGCNVVRQRFGWYLQRASQGESFQITRRGERLARLLPAAQTEIVAAQRS